MNRWPASAAVFAAACFFLSLPARAADSSGAAARRLSCQALTAAGIFENTTISTATALEANSAKRIPAHCEVVGHISPATGSRIGVVYRLPDNWNGKLLGLGGGGWAGNTRVETAVMGLERGYATLQTDTGHESNKMWDTSWAGSSQALEDFSHRAIHLMTHVGKAVAAKYYGRTHSKAYFEGCSTGGRQGLMEVQRYPADYDGVIAGAPVYNLITQTNLLVRNQAFDAPGARLSSEQLKRLNDASMAACDAEDGLRDGIITDPRTCKFNPISLKCSDDSLTAGCLSAAQVAAVRAVYAGVLTVDAGTAAYPLTRGGELGWTRFLAGSRTDGGLPDLRTVLFGNREYDLDAFNPDTDQKTVRNSAFAKMYEAADPDIGAFVKNGGKLILWHGFDDPGPSALATIEYFEQVRRVTGPKVQALPSSMRLFIASGVYHCTGGPGADKFDLLSALEQWAERGQAPEAILATRTDGRLSRPLCPYPALPRYTGQGNPDEAASFECR